MNEGGLSVADKPLRSFILIAVFDHGGKAWNVSLKPGFQRR